MVVVQLKAGPGMWTDHGKREIANAMIHRGEQFLGGAILLKQQGGNGYVWRHLICQGAELIMKGCLLHHDYDRYKPLLKGFGHRLVVLSDACTKLFGLRPAAGTLRQQLERISELYEHHELRYASGLDILIDPSTLEIDSLTRRLYAVSILIRRSRRRGLRPA